MTDETKSYEAPPGKSSQEESERGFMSPGAQRYHATVPTEGTLFFIDLDGPSVPAPVPMGPYRRGTERLIAELLAAHPALEREEAIEYLWEAGGL